MADNSDEEDEELMTGNAANDLLVAKFADVMSRVARRELAPLEQRIAALETRLAHLESRVGGDAKIAEKTGRVIRR